MTTRNRTLQVSSNSTTAFLFDEQFERLLDRLAKDIVDAAVFAKLREDIYSTAKEHWREFNQSPTFWSLCVQAYAEVVMYRLSRVYVSNKMALSLERWLEAIRDNPQLFTDPADANQLRADLASVGYRDPVVKKLIGLRGNFIAHINWDNTADGGMKIGHRFAMSGAEIDELISRAKDILNRYSVLFKRTHWSTNMSGNDDFRYLLKAVRAELKRQEAEIAVQIEGANS